jgi:hypothetical protein
MRTLLILAGLFFFLHSSWAPSWGAHLANWSLLLAALSYFGGMASKISYRRNRLYDNDYYDKQQP